MLKSDDIQKSEKCSPVIGKLLNIPSGPEPRWIVVKKKPPLSEWSY